MESVERTLFALLVEDDSRIAELTSSYLHRHGIAVTRIASGSRAIQEALRGRFDIVLLDLTLPDMDGLDVCRELRAALSVPIIVITARGEEADRVMGLELGADDYLPKPFSARELLARIRAVVRRATGRAGPPTDEIHVGALSLHPASRRAILRGEELALTSYEFSLLYALASRAGRILSREQLIELAGGKREESFERSIDVHVSRLRHKLGDNPRRPRFLKTVRGAGYILTAEAGR